VKPVVTKVTFYKLAKDAPSLKLVCQLIKKACLSQQKVLCLVADDQTAEQLDQLLWAFETVSFVAHGIGVDQQPVAISVEAEPGDHHQILINLQGEIPTWFSRFERVIELVQPESENEQTKRENFKFYKERGYALDFHDLSNSFS
jgi:DNA polymerase-3 subunit chi